MFSTLKGAILLTILWRTVSFHTSGVGIRERTAAGQSPRGSSRTVSVARLATEAGDQGRDVAVTRRDALERALGTALGASVVFQAGMSLAPSQAHARKAGVNRPDLLPKGQTNVIDLVDLLTKGQEKRINKQIEAVEKETGYRLRLLCQRYPNTPGLAVKDYWQVDEKTVVMVVDQGEEDNKAGAVNILNFNVGDAFRLSLPAQFWQRLQNKYGNKFYVRDNGPDTAVIAAVESIALCLRSPSGFCVDPPDLDKAAREKAVLASVGKGGLKE